MKSLGFLGLVFDAGLSVTPLMGHLGCLASYWSVPVWFSLQDFLIDGSKAPSAPSKIKGSRLGIRIKQGGLVRDRGGLYFHFVLWSGKLWVGYWQQQDRPYFQPLPSHLTLLMLYLYFSLHNYCCIKGLSIEAKICRRMLSHDFYFLSVWQTKNKSWG